MLQNLDRAAIPDHFPSFWPILEGVSSRIRQRLNYLFSVFRSRMSVEHWGLDIVISQELLGGRQINPFHNESSREGVMLSYSGEVDICWLG